MSLAELAPPEDGVMFEAMTVAEYMAYHDLLRQAHETAKGGGKAL